MPSALLLSPNPHHLRKSWLYGASALEPASLTILASNGNSQPGGLPDGFTDGNTFTLSGVNEAARVDNQGNAPIDTITISGDCRDGVTITYRDPNTEATFTGNVECTLT